MRAIAAVLAMPLAATTAAAGPATLNRVYDIAPALAACWHPPHADDQVTVRLSFTRDGALIGRPRLTYIHSNAGPDGDAALANSMLDALRACTPLHFSAALGGAVAGRVFAIRLIGIHHSSVINQL